MARIFRPTSDGGYALVDSLVALFLAGAVAVAICAAVGGASRLSAKALARLSGDIERRNAVAASFMGIDARE